MRLLFRRGYVIRPLLKMLNTKRYLWKGKCVSEAIYNQRLIQSKVGKKRKLNETDETTSPPLEETTPLPPEENSNKQAGEI